VKFPPRHSARTCTLACALLLSGPSAAAEAESLLDVDAGGFYDSNLTRAQNQPDIRADGAATLAASVGSFFALSGNDRLTSTLDARGEAYHRFHGLNVIGIGGSAVYRHKFGLGYAPWLTLAGSAAYDAYQQDLRTGARWAALVELGQRFNERFDAAIGGVLELTLRAERRAGGTRNLGQGLRPERRERLSSSRLRGHGFAVSRREGFRAPGRRRVDDATQC
jgi:hypothetical protein